MPYSINDLRSAHLSDEDARDEVRQDARAEARDNADGERRIQAEQASPAFRRGSQPVRPATANQIAKLRELAAERRPDVGETFIQSVIDGGFDRVSQGISNLLATPRPERTQRQADPTRPRPNRYGGVCILCSVRVEAGEGYVAMSDQGTWEVWHQDGQCPTAFPFPVGRYAVTLDDTIHFFVFREESISEQAGDTLYPVGGPRRQQVIDLIAADPEAASRLYGREIGHCGRCGRSLTDTESRAQGIGPVCASKGW